jgi:hypothetical protein
MPERNHQSVPSQPLRSVNEAFQVLLKHFRDHRIAVQRLKEIPLWGYKDRRCFETDLDRYSLCIDVYQTPDGWQASLKMQPGRIGIADFDSYWWAYSKKKVDALCESSVEDIEHSRRRGRKVKYEWPVYQAEFFGRLFFNDVGPHDEVNVEQMADDLMTWGQRHLGDDKTPARTATQEKISEWTEIWKRKPKTEPEELR